LTSSRRLTDEAAARTKAIEYFHVEPALQFQVVAVKVGSAKIKETESAK